MNPKSVTTLTLKQMNKNTVYQYIYRQRETSKVQIVQDLQMGLSTVTQNLTALEKEGKIERKGYFASTGGRKAQIIRIVPDLQIAIGVGVLKQMVHLAAVNLYGEAMDMTTIPLAYEDTPEYYDALAKEIFQFIEAHHYPSKKISGISIATQGIIAPDGASVTYGAIMGNTRMQLADFASRLPWPCHLVHDSKAAADLELWNHPELDSAIVFLLNRNLGGAVITNHQVHQGLTMHSGSLEHICVQPDGPLCYCGNHGCLETFCSANALEMACGMDARDFFRILRSETQNESTGSMIDIHGSKSDPVLKDIWQDYMKHLAFAIRNLNLLIDCPVILSGYLAPFFLQEDLDQLLSYVNESTPFPLSKSSLLSGTHGQYTPAIGAALFYVKEFLNSFSKI